MSLTAYIRMLDAFYFDKVVARTPPAVRDILVRGSVLGGDERSGDIQSLGEVFAEEDLALPWLLKDVFLVDESICIEVAKAHLLMVVAFVLFDHMMDGQVPASRLIVLAQHVVMQRFYDQLLSIPGIDTASLQRVESHLGVYYTAMAQESAYLDGASSTKTEEALASIYPGKTSLFNITLEAFDAASRHHEAVEPLTVVLRHIGTAYQLTDDLKDWWEDYQKLRFTLPLRTCLSFPFPRTLSQDALRLRLHRKGVFATLIAHIDRELVEAEAMLAAIPHGAAQLKAYTRHLRDSTIRWLGGARLTHVLAMLASADS